MKYIDAEKLIAEIKIIQQSLESRDVRLNQVKKIRTECSIEFCKCITDVITTLQQEQPEVDLEKEILDWIGDEDSCKNGKWTWDECNKMLRHFYELGLKAGKEE